MGKIKIEKLDINYCNYYGYLLEINDIKIKECNCNKEHIKENVNIEIEYYKCPKCGTLSSTWWKIQTKPRIPWYIKVDLFNIIKNYYPIQQAREKETTIFYGAFGAGIYLYCPVCNSLL